VSTRLANHRLALFCPVPFSPDARRYLGSWFMAITSSLVRTASGSRMIREVRGRFRRGMGVVAIRSSHQGAGPQVETVSSRAKEARRGAPSTQVPRRSNAPACRLEPSAAACQCGASSQFTIWAAHLPSACAPRHARHRYKVEPKWYGCSKVQRRKQLLEENLHRLWNTATPDETGKPWATANRKVFLGFG